MIIKATWQLSQSLDDSVNRHARNFVDICITSVSWARLGEEEDAVGEHTIMLDILAAPDPNDYAPILEHDAALDCILKAAIVSAKKGKPWSAKFVLPAETGYIVRSDFLEERMRGCKLVLSTQSFVSPGQRCVPSRVALTDGSCRALSDILGTSIGVVVVDEDVMVPDGLAIGLLDRVFLNRIAYPWVVPDMVEPKRIVIIGEKREAGGCERFYDAAKACGVSIVVLDKPGHWMQNSEGLGPKYREAFVPFSDFNFETLSERIVEAVRALPYRVDGIMTNMDPFLAGVARAAEILGLPTSSPEAYRRATDKYETRLMQETTTMLIVSDIDELKSNLALREEPLEYPLIVKPTRNHGSYGVSVVRSEDELHNAIQHAIGSVRDQHKLFGVHEADAKAIVETYCEGPEVDVNFVLWNGELLFSEVVDNLPCSGDDALNSVQTEQFVETGSVWPSGLPSEETSLLRTDLLKIVRRLGFHSGVIHVEAKVNKSRVDWHMDTHGVLEFIARRERHDEDTSSFLLEVNPRPPGHSDSTGSAYVNGVDYYALYLMQVTGDEARFRSLAHGFASGAQYSCATSPLPIRTSGRLLSDINFESVAQQDPELASSTLLLRSFFRPGELVPTPAELRYPWLGFAMLCSRRGRRDLLEKVRAARNDIHFEVQDL